MKRLKYLLFLFLIVELFFLTGCNKSLKNVAQEELRKKYNEDFNIYNIQDEGSSFTCMASPINEPDIIFVAEMDNNGNGLLDHYFQAYLGKLIIDEMNPELQQFYYEYYVDVNSIFVLWPSEEDFRGMDIKEILSKADINHGENEGCVVYIYINGDKGTTGKYDEEYEFFNSKINDYMDDGRMLPLSIAEYYIQDGHFEEIKNYYQKGLGNTKYVGDIKKDYKKIIFSSGIKGRELTQVEFIELKKEFEK